ncbi:hypothetical protein ACX9I7_29775 [Streptomyces sp. L500]|uniref:hypothetical protein n=1 Tax=Streptomyces abikoensis TaxID=97398 RepID=UPI0036989DCD
MAESTTAAGSAGTRATGAPPAARTPAEQPPYARGALGRPVTVGTPLSTHRVHLFDEGLQRGLPPETIAGGAS